MCWAIACKPKGFALLALQKVTSTQRLQRCVRIFCSSERLGPSKCVTRITTMGSASDQRNQVDSSRESVLTEPITLITAVLGAALTISGCKQTASSAAAAKPPSVPVAEVIVRPATPYVEFNGSLTAVKRVELRPQALATFRP